MQIEFSILPQPGGSLFVVAIKPNSSKTEIFKSITTFQHSFQLFPHAVLFNGTTFTAFTQLGTTYKVRKSDILKHIYLHIKRIFSTLNALPCI